MNLCVESASAEGDADLVDRLSELLQDLDLVSLIEEKSEDCSQSLAPYKLIALKVKKLDNNDLRVSGTYIDPDKKDEYSITCVGCASETDQRGFETAFGLFLNSTLFGWGRSPVAALRMPGCRPHRLSVSTKATLEPFEKRAGPDVLEERFWGLGGLREEEREGLDGSRRLSVTITPRNVFFKPRSGPSVSLSNNSTEVTLRFHRKHTRYDRRAFWQECEGSDALNRILLPYYHVLDSYLDDPPDPFELPLGDIKVR